MNMLQKSLLALVTCFITMNVQAPAAKDALPEQDDEITIQAVSDVDINRKSTESKKLVMNAVAHFKKVSVQEACNDFINNTICAKENFLFLCLKHLVFAWHTVMIMNLSGRI